MMPTTTARQTPSPISPPLVIPIEIAGSSFLVGPALSAPALAPPAASNGVAATSGTDAVSALTGSIWP